MLSQVTTYNTTATATEMKGKKEEEDKETAESQTAIGPFVRRETKKKEKNRERFAVFENVPDPHLAASL
jgi:hypothetical protein